MFPGFDPAAIAKPFTDKMDELISKLSEVIVLLKKIEQNTQYKL